jgi:hypothetical protein
MTFADVAALESEVEQNLSHGRAFVRGTYAIEALSDCTLVLVHPTLGSALSLPAQAVMVSSSGAFAGVGVELRPFDPEVAERIACFVEDGGVGAAESEDGDGDGDAHEDEDAHAHAHEDEDAHEDVDEDVDVDEDEDAHEDTHEDGDEGEREEGAGREGGIGEALEELEEEPSGKAPDVQVESRQEQLRKLNNAEQVKLARGGELSDRIALERMYGKNVWEALLSNPRLTVPEVARMARKGTVPKPLLEQIVDNASWCRAVPVRRALLGNHRISNDSVLKILRLVPKPELKQIVKGTAYPLNVRDAAKKLLKKDG